MEHMEVPVELLPEPRRGVLPPDFLIRDLGHADNIVLDVPDRRVNTPDPRHERMVSLLDRNVGINNKQPTITSNDVQPLLQSRPFIELGFLRPEHIRAVAGHWERLRELFAKLDSLRVIS